MPRFPQHYIGNLTRGLLPIISVTSATTRTTLSERPSHRELILMRASTGSFYGGSTPIAGYGYFGAGMSPKIFDFGVKRLR